MNVLFADGVEIKESDTLYVKDEKVQLEPVQIRLIPYCCHANRGESDMLVWLSKI